MRLALLLLMVACQRVRPEAPPPRSAVDPSDPGVAVAAPVKALTPLAVGPDRVDLGAVEVGVPEGWVAWPREDGARVRYTDGTEIVVVVSAAADLPDRKGCTWRFDDEVGRYREIPGLTVSRVAHCEAERLDADLIQVWLGRMGGEGVRIERHLPVGSLVTGVDAAAEVLGGIHPSWDSR